RREPFSWESFSAARRVRTQPSPNELRKARRTMPEATVPPPRVSRADVSSRIALGVAVIAFGVLFTLDTLGIVDAGSVLRLWPLVFVYWGAYEILGWGHRRRAVMGAILAFVGIWMVLYNYGVVPVAVTRLWPLVLIALGAKLVYAG